MSPENTLNHVKYQKLITGTLSTNNVYETNIISREKKHFILKVLSSNFVFSVSILHLLLSMVRISDGGDYTKPERFE